MSRPPLSLPSAAAELDLVYEAIAAGYCCRASLAAALGCDPTAIAFWRRRGYGPPGLLGSLARHLDADGRRWLLGRLAELLEVGGDNVVDLVAARELAVARAAFEAASEAIERGWRAALKLQRRAA